MTMFSQYIYSSIIHTVNNSHLYLPNYEIHKYRTRYNKDLHLPIANTKKYKEVPYCCAIKLYNHLPEYIKSLSSDQKHFKNKLKEFLCQNPVYSIQEYYEFKDIC
jgi:alpha-acetolactate decarboxylase